ncbi:MAG: glycosyltransferase [Lentisphaeria bacterium]|nr:glycosyltransferase [Lentisphaeria bacterium]
MSIIHTIKDKLYGKFLPCYVICRKPLIFFSYWEDLHSYLGDFAKRLEKESAVEVICQLGWHYETEERGERLEREYLEVMSRLPRLKIRFVTNSPEEEAILRRHGMTADFCHQNAFIDEKKLPLYCPDKREFDAIYLARITPFKRQELAAKVPRLYLVSAWVHLAERAYADQIHAMMPNASFGDKISYCNVSKEMSRAAVGLCLSAEEGAMFVSAEYLLSGLSVVSTKNLGGREWVMPKEYWRRAEDNPDSVAAAVEELKNLHADPVDVRAKTLEMFRPHREKMCAILKGIFDSYGLDGARLSAFDKWFTHKLGLRCTLLPWKQVSQGLLKG